MTARRYFGEFTDRDSVLKEFSKGKYNYDTGKYDQVDIPGFPEDGQILFADYSSGGYDGHVRVIYQEPDGELKIVDGGHCSCYGLEDQWEPKPTTRAALGMMWRDTDYFVHSEEAVRAFQEMFPPAS